MPKKKKGSGFAPLKRGTARSVGRARYSQGSDSLISTGDEEAMPRSPLVCSDGDNSDTSSVFNLASSLGESHLSDQDTSGSVHANDSVLSQECVVSETVFEEARISLTAIAPAHYRIILDREGFHALCFSRRPVNFQLQRSVYAAYDGSMRIFVHKKEILGELRDDIMKDVVCIPLTSLSVKEFSHNVAKVVSSLKHFEICAGVDDLQLEDLWVSDSSGRIDYNHYDESRYDKSFRSNDCSLLVPVRKWRCTGCSRVLENQKHRKKTLLKEELHAHTRNDLLDEGRKKQKLLDLKKQLKSATKKLDYLSKKVHHLMEKEAVVIDTDLGEQLTDILRDSDLDPVKQLFIQQQFKSAEVKKSRGMRWHPTMIRFALLIKSTSSAAYRALRNSGLINLPGERTLFDYEHAIPRSEGVFTEKLHAIGKTVQDFKYEHQHFHSLLMDEIHISKKLVYRKSDGQLIGYVKLDEVESEMEKLNVSIKKGEMSENEPEVATKILAYMVKGCTSSVKEVVAAFTTGCLTKEQLFSKTWQVIRACEGVGVKILAVVCDGSSVNRGFFSMHTPATKTVSGVVFDTINMCALDRTIFFISDPPHLLKTIRNCFAKSGQKPGCTRLLTVNDEFVEWKTIVRLYVETMNDTLRRSFKLNSQNVFLNSYTCMKVSYAAQVLSRTVGLELKTREWPKTAETVRFILKVNDFFDNLNGAHTSAGKMTANYRLEPYRSVEDKRFKELKEFEDYIRGWEEQVHALNVSDSQKTKMTLSAQTVEGIYITVNGFTGAMKSLLSMGAMYVNARAFCQDPLEQYFSKQRASGGGRNSVSADTFFSSDVKISIHRDLNINRKSSNIASSLKTMEIDDSPLAKRKKF